MPAATRDPGAENRDASPRSEPRAAPPSEPRAALESALLRFFESERPRLYEEIEEIVFRTAYRFSDNNQLRAARLLGISRNVVRARLLRHGLLVSTSRRERRGRGRRSGVGAFVSFPVRSR